MERGCSRISCTTETGDTVHCTCTEATDGVHVCTETADKCFSHIRSYLQYCTIGFDRMLYMRFKRCTVQLTNIFGSVSTFYGKEYLHPCKGCTGNVYYTAGRKWIWNWCGSPNLNSTHFPILYWTGNGPNLAGSWRMWWINTNAYDRTIG
jgi:hypothetical protein